MQHSEQVFGVFGKEIVKKIKDELLVRNKNHVVTRIGTTWFFEKPTLLLAKHELCRLQERMTHKVPSHEENERFYSARLGLVSPSDFLKHANPELVGFVLILFPVVWAPLPLAVLIEVEALCT